MVLRKLTLAAAFAGVIAASLPLSMAAALGGTPSPADGQTRYLPIESVSYAFGSKMMSGYFVRQSGQCLVTLMIIEKSAEEMPLAQTPARLRLALNPGQTAGLDSEEGRSLNLTCGGGASALLVDSGARDQLVQLQMQASPRDMARAP